MARFNKHNRVTVKRPNPMRLTYQVRNHDDVVVRYVFSFTDRTYTCRVAYYCRNGETQRTKVVAPLKFSKITTDPNLNKLFRGDPELIACCGEMLNSPDNEHYIVQELASSASYYLSK